MRRSDRDPELAGALQDLPGWVPVEHDWSFRAERTQGGFNRYGWSRADQGRFASLPAGPAPLARLRRDS